MSYSNQGARILLPPPPPPPPGLCVWSSGCGEVRYGYGTYGRVVRYGRDGGGGTEGGMNEKVERNQQECEPLANFLAKLFYIRALV